MEIGWIDFNKTDRDKVLNVIKLFSEQGAVDELGIGTIRDAFANTFFPGTSTIQTRAKYFFIVSYLLAEAGKGEAGNDVDRALEWVQKQEFECCKQLINSAISHKQGLTGIIGHTAVDSKNWVIRKPTDIYWNGIKTLGFFNNKSDLLRYISIKEYLRLSLIMNKERNIKNLGKKCSSEDDDHDDDITIGSLYYNYWNISTPPNWRNELSIDLTYKEAAFFKEAINTKYPTSVFNCLLNNWDNENKRITFPKVAALVMPLVDSKTQELLQLALKFDIFVYSARCCYNIILSDGANDTAQQEWSSLIPELTNIANIDLLYMMTSLGLKQPKTYNFLLELQEAYKQPYDFDKIKYILIKREKDLKKGRAKLLNPSKDNLTWIGGKHLDYRTFNACQIIIDIKQHV